MYSVTCTVYTAQSESGEALDKQNPVLIKQLSKIQEITHNSIGVKHCAVMNVCTCKMFLTAQRVASARSGSIVIEMILAAGARQSPGTHLSHTFLIASQWQIRLIGALSSTV